MVIRPRVKQRDRELSELVTTIPGSPRSARRRSGRPATRTATTVPGPGSNTPGCARDNESGAFAGDHDFAARSARVARRGLARGLGRAAPQPCLRRQVHPPDRARREPAARWAGPRRDRRRAAAPAVHRGHPPGGLGRRHRRRRHHPQPATRPLPPPTRASMAPTRPGWGQQLCHAGPGRVAGGPITSVIRSCSDRQVGPELRRHPGAN